MFMRVHRRPEDTIVALCDAELMGRVLREGGAVIDLDKYGGFYKGEKVGEEKAAEALKSATSINAVGEKSVGVVRKAVGFAEDKVKFIQGMPHVQAYKV